MNFIVATNYRHPRESGGSSGQRCSLAALGSRFQGCNPIAQALQSSPPRKRGPGQAHEIPRFPLPRERRTKTPSGTNSNFLTAAFAGTTPRSGRSLKAHRSFLASLSAILAMLLAEIGLAPVAAGEEPKPGGILIYVIAADAPPSFDAHREQTFATVYSVAPFYSVLIRVNPDNPGSPTDFVCDLLHRDAAARRRRQDLHLSSLT
jgi:hypothetical protein